MSLRRPVTREEFRAAMVALELDPEKAPAGAVLRAYRRLSKVHHPDRPTGDAADFRRVTEAKDLLLDVIEGRRAVEQPEARHGVTIAVRVKVPVPKVS